MNEDDLPMISGYVLTEVDIPLFADFDCGQDVLGNEWPAELNGYIRENALEDGANDFSRTYVFYDGAKPYAYVSLACAHIQIEIDGDIRAVPAMLIGRIAVDKGHQNSQYGAAILAWAKTKARASAADVGCRFVALHVQQDNVSAIRFYERWRFFTPEYQTATDVLMLFDLHEGQKEAPAS